MATIVEEGLRLKIAVHPADPATRSKLKQDGRDGDYCFARKEKRGDQDVTRHYVAGVASGLKQDAHRERMSEKCIDGFLEQAETKDILLVVNHGRNFTESVAILTHSELLENGDWYIEARLLDEYDLEDHPTWTARVAEADDIRAQMTGSAPYKKPRVFGFSIEGWILEIDEDTKTIHKLDLEAIAIVTRPAYETSVASSLEKCLKSWSSKMAKPQPGEAGAHREKGILSDRLAAAEASRKRYDIIWAFNDLMHETITDEDLSVEEQRERIQAGLDEFVEVMGALVEQIGETKGSGADGQVALAKSLKDALGSGKRASAKSRQTALKLLADHRAKDLISARLERNKASGDFYTRLIEIEEVYESELEKLLQSDLSPEAKESAFDELHASRGNNLKALYAANGWAEPADDDSSLENSMETEDTQEQEEQAKSSDEKMDTLMGQLSELLAHLRGDENKSKSETEGQDTEGEDAEEPEDSDEAAKAVKSLANEVANMQAAGAKTGEVLEMLAKSVQEMAGRVDGMEGTMVGTLKSIFGMGEDDLVAFTQKSEEGESGQEDSEPKGKGGSVGESELAQALKALGEMAKKGAGDSDSAPSTFAAKSQTSADRVRGYGRAALSG